MNEQLLAKVRALLAKAESTEFPAEAEIFNRKAAELIARYGIDEALLAASGATTDTIQQIVISMDNPYSMEKATLLTAVAKSLRCEAVAHKSGRTAERCTVVGYGSDLERVELIYTSLLLQAVSQVTQQHPTTRAYSTVAYRKSWFTGFANAVWNRLQETERRAAADTVGRTAGVSTELVLRDRTKEVNREFVSLFPSVETNNVSADCWSEGYGNGRQAGQRAALGGTRIGQHHNALAR